MLQWLLFFDLSEKNWQSYGSHFICPILSYDRTQEKKQLDLLIDMSEKVEG